MLMENFISYFLWITVPVYTLLKSNSCIDWQSLGKRNILVGSNETTSQPCNHETRKTFTIHTGCIRIQCHTTAGSISGQQCYEFGVSVTWQSGLVWSRLWSKSASQIKTIDTLVVIQIEPAVVWHGILIHPVVWEVVSSLPTDSYS